MKKRKQLLVTGLALLVTFSLCTSFSLLPRKSYPIQSAQPFPALSTIKHNLQPEKFCTPWFTVESYVGPLLSIKYTNAQGVVYTYNNPTTPFVIPRSQTAGYGPHKLFITIGAAHNDFSARVITTEGIVLDCRNIASNVVGFTISFSTYNCNEVKIVLSPEPC